MADPDPLVDVARKIMGNVRAFNDAQVYEEQPIGVCDNCGRADIEVGDGPEGSTVCWDCLNASASALVKRVRCQHETVVPSGTGWLCSSCSTAFIQVECVYAPTRLDALRQLHWEGYVVVERSEYERWSRMPGG